MTPAYFSRKGGVNKLCPGRMKNIVRNGKRVRIHKHPEMDRLLIAECRLHNGNQGVFIRRIIEDVLLFIAFGGAAANRRGFNVSVILAHGAVVSFFSVLCALRDVAHLRLAFLFITVHAH